jgi:hypothetical protein
LLLVVALVAVVLPVATEGVQPGVSAAAGPPVIAIGDARIVEGDTGSARTVQFPVTLSQPSSGAVSVRYELTACGAVTTSCARTNEVALKTGTARFRPGASHKLVTAKVASDAVSEDDEYFGVRLSNPVGGYALLDSSAKGWIEDDEDPLVALGMGIGDVSVWEGDRGKARPVKVWVNLSRPAPSAITATVVLRPTGASSGVDFRAWRKAKTVTFRPGAYQRPVTVQVLPDLVDEATEDLELAVTTTGAKVVRPIGTVKILDDDGSIAAPNPPSAVVDPGVTPRMAEMPGPDGVGTTDVGALEDASGTPMDFVLDEMLVATSNAGALADFLARRNGHVVKVIQPGTIAAAAFAARGVPRFPTMYQVQVDSSTADLDALEDNLTRMIEGNPQPEPPTDRTVPQEIDLRFSNTRALSTFAIAIEEKVEHGLTVSVNPIAQNAAYEDSDSPESDPPVGLAGYTKNAFLWPHMENRSVAAGGQQDIGVADAWRLLENNGRSLRTGVPVGPIGGPQVVVIDGGFDPNADFPPYSGSTFVGNPNPMACSGGNECLWHGTHVVETGFGLPHNDFGVAGPGGPVVNNLALVATPRISWTLVELIWFVFVDIPIMIGRMPDIVNMSWGFNMPAIVCGVVCPLLDPVTAAIDAAGVLLIAAAGNDGDNVDAEDCFAVCWEETAHWPCEGWGVMCIGGLAMGARSIHPSSNWGGDPSDSSTVDLYAPYNFWVGRDDDDPVGSAAVKLDGGTSYSAPFVAGVATLVWSALGYVPLVQDDIVESILLGTAHHDLTDAEARASTRANRLRRVGWVDAMAAVGRAYGGNTPPFLNINAPDEGQQFVKGLDSSVPLRCTAQDEEDGNLGASVVWTSNLVPGSTWTGCNTSAPLLGGLQIAAGTHTFTASLRDRGGRLATRTRTVTVLPPTITVRITEPEDGDTVTTGQDVHLQGVSFDPTIFGPIPDAEVLWICREITSGGADLGPCDVTGPGQGVFGLQTHTPTIAAGELTPGRKRITFLNADAFCVFGCGPSPATDSIEITVVPCVAGCPPSAVITSPDDETYEIAELINGGWYRRLTLHGAATDAEDGTLPGSALEWRITRVGDPLFLLVRTGSSPTVDLPALGCAPTTYRIQLKATDSDGKSDTYTITASTDQLC